MAILGPTVVNGVLSVNGKILLNGTEFVTPTKATVGLSNVNNWGATTAVNSTSTTTYATASAVKQAYDLAASKMTQATGDGRYLTKGNWSTNGGQDLLVHGKRAMVGMTNGTLYLGYGGDFNTLYFGSNLVYHAGRKPSKTDVGLSAVNNWGASSAVNSASTTTYATTAGVKTAYDLAATKVTQAQGDARYVQSSIARINNSTVTYGWSGLQYVNFSGVGGTGGNGAQLKNPTSDWYHHIVMNHANSSGFYVDFAICFHSNTAAFRRVASGTDNGWQYFYHSGNKPNKNDVGLNLVNNWSATSSVSDASNAKYATAGAAKTAYDRGTAALNAANTKITKAQGDGYYSKVAGRVVRNYNDQRTSGMFGVEGAGANGPSNNSYGALIVAANSDTGLQIAGGHSNNMLAFRGWSSSGGSFHAWNNVYHTGWKPNKTDVGLSAVNNWGATSSVSDASNAKYATAGAVKTAYDRGTAALNAANSKLASGGTASTLYVNNWFRANGQTGLYFETYGGGWYMVDTTWIRNYGSKPLYVNNQIACTSNVTAYYSDERLKENIRDIDNPLDIVRQWRGVRYNANKLAFDLAGYNRDKQEIGLLACDLKSTTPELVSIAPFDLDENMESKSGENYLTVDYARTTPILVEAIKALDKEVTELKTLVAYLLNKEPQNDIA